MSGIKGGIIVTRDFRVLCRVSDILTLLPLGPDLNVNDVCFTWKNTVQEALDLLLYDDFSGRPSLDSCVNLGELELVEAELVPEENKLYIL